MTDDAFCRPATFDDVKRLVESLNEKGVDYLLIGGYALYAHGYQRATTDIDILVEATSEAGALVREALLALPDGAAKDIDPEWFDEGENIRVADAFVVDVMLSANGHSYEALRKYAEVIDLDGLPVRTLNLSGLLLTKQTSRDKDIADRAVLERALAAQLRAPLENPSLSASPLTRQTPSREGDPGPARPALWKRILRR